MRSRISTPATAAAVLALLSGCGSSSPVILNTERVERAIEQSIKAQRTITANVSCPSGVHQKQGLNFSCSATTRTGTYVVDVRQVDGRGHVSYVVH